MSSPKFRLLFAAEADDDIADILYHSRARWGEEQERRYAEGLDRAFVLLSASPYIGRARDDLHPGYRTYPVGQHVIVYRTTDNAVIVLRVIHSRRDLHRTLEEASE